MRSESHLDIKPHSPSPSASSSSALPLFYYSYYVIYGFLSSPHCLEFATPCCQISVWSIQSQCSAANCLRLSLALPPTCGVHWFRGLNSGTLCSLSWPSVALKSGTSLSAVLVVRRFTISNVAFHLTCPVFYVLLALFSWGCLVACSMTDVLCILCVFGHVIDDSVYKKLSYSLASKAPGLAECVCVCVLHRFGTVLSSSKHSVLIVTVSYFLFCPPCFIWYCISRVFCCSFCHYHLILRVKRHTKYIYDDCLYCTLPRSLRSVLCILYISSIRFLDICGMPLS